MLNSILFITDDHPANGVNIKRLKKIILLLIFFMRYIYFSKMQLPRYTYKTNENFLDYEFGSTGPKGNIKKVVRFTQISNNVFNLGFGDLDEETGEISDINVTNNNDSRKVLATVAATVQDFTLQYPGTWIIAKGSTLSRTRLYRIGITNHWDEISAEFKIFGLKDGAWESFEMRRDYEAFLVRRK